MGEVPRKEVAVIIPAFNEEQRILTVLTAAKASKLTTEIIVVDDGSMDKTAEVARSVEGVRVIRLKTNRGKGGAMVKGVQSTRAPILAFVDADLAGLKGSHIDDIIRPLLHDQCDMCVGIFRGGKVWSDMAQRVAPYLSGQRAMKRDLFEAVPLMAELRMGVEWALKSAADRRKAKVIKVLLRGVSNCFKEEKLGLMKGLKARGMMYKEITEAMVKTRRRRPPFPLRGRLKRRR
jgi:glycosyltransferase involved in cell wall biosynthesis